MKDKTIQSTPRQEELFELREFYAGEDWREQDLLFLSQALMLTMLGGLAEFERELIRARTGEGRERAKQRGVKFGRPSKLTAHQRREAIARRERGDLLTEIARTYNVHDSTISRLRA
jgi:DNA invertase Pin-like site-specific DNA recombinase